MPASDPPTAAASPAQIPTPAAPGENKLQGNATTPKQENTQEAAKPKLSGAELKAKAKAEKAARRAQEKKEKAGARIPLAVSSPGGQQQQSKLPGQKIGQVQGQGQNRRGALSSVEARNLPVRGGAQKSTSVPEEPKKEDKTVEFFRHLYKPRTTTIAGASKDVHPAVLALGLQMSNYTICGSCARLVATLQAFKRVSLSSFELISQFR